MFFYFSKEEAGDPMVLIWPIPFHRHLHLSKKRYNFFKGSRSVW